MTIFEATVTKFEKARFNLPAVNQEASLLADRIGQSAVNNLKLAIANKGAVASGDTIRSIRLRQGQSRGLSPFGVAATGLHTRQVIGDRSLLYINTGRKAGSKQPIRFVGRGVRGGKIFEPLPNLIKWFKAVGIPQDAWFPVLRAFSRRGIKPRKVNEEALRMTRRIARQYSLQTRARIKATLIQKF